MLWFGVGLCMLCLLLMCLYVLLWVGGLVCWCKLILCLMCLNRCCIIGVWVSCWCIIVIVVCSIYLFGIWIGLLRWVLMFLLVWLVIFMIMCLLRWLLGCLRLRLFGDVVCGEMLMRLSLLFWNGLIGGIISGCLNGWIMFCLLSLKVVIINLIIF